MFKLRVLVVVFFFNHQFEFPNIVNRAPLSCIPPHDTVLTFDSSAFGSSCASESAKVVQEGIRHRDVWKSNQPSHGP